MNNLSNFKVAAPSPLMFWSSIIVWESPLISTFTLMFGLISLNVLMCLISLWVRSNVEWALNSKRKMLGLDKILYLTVVSAFNGGVIAFKGSLAFCLFLLLLISLALFSIMQFSNNIVLSSVLCWLSPSLIVKACYYKKSFLLQSVVMK